MHGKNDVLSLEMGEKKIRSASEAGADLICVGCTHCQMQFDRIGAQMKEQGENGKVLLSILYPQLLGLSLGLDEKSLGINQNLLEQLQI
jgi:heterodisulfide reductase subunit B